MLIGFIKNIKKVFSKRYFLFFCFFLFLNQKVFAQIPPMYDLEESFNNYVGSPKPPWFPECKLKDLPYEVLPFEKAIFFFPFAIPRDPFFDFRAGLFDYQRFLDDYQKSCGKIETIETGDSGMYVEEDYSQLVLPSTNLEYPTYTYVPAPIRNGEEILYQEHYPPFLSPQETIIPYEQIILPGTPLPSPTEEDLPPYEQLVLPGGPVEAYTQLIYPTPFSTGTPAPTPTFSIPFVVYYPAFIFTNTSTENLGGLNYYDQESFGYWQEFCNGLAPDDIPGCYGYNDLTHSSPAKTIERDNRVYKYYFKSFSWFNPWKPVYWPVPEKVPYPYNPLAYPHFPICYVSPENDPRSPDYGQVHCVGRLMVLSEEIYDKIPRSCFSGERPPCYNLKILTSTLILDYKKILEIMSPECKLEGFFEGEEPLFEEIFYDPQKFSFYWNPRVDPIKFLQMIYERLDPYDVVPDGDQKQWDDEISFTAYDPSTLEPIDATATVETVVGSREFWEQRFWQGEWWRWRNKDTFFSDFYPQVILTDAQNYDLRNYFDYKILTYLRAPVLTCYNSRHLASPTPTPIIPWKIAVYELKEEQPNLWQANLRSLLNLDPSISYKFNLFGPYGLPAVLAEDGNIYSGSYSCDLFSSWYSPGLDDVWSDCLTWQHTLVANTVTGNQGFVYDPEYSFTAPWIDYYYTTEPKTYTCVQDDFPRQMEYKYNILGELVVEDDYALKREIPYFLNDPILNENEGYYRINTFWSTGDLWANYVFLYPLLPVVRDDFEDGYMCPYLLTGCESPYLKQWVEDIAQKITPRKPEGCCKLGNFSDIEPRIPSYQTINMKEILYINPRMGSEPLEVFPGASGNISPVVNVQNGSFDNIVKKRFNVSLETNIIFQADIMFGCCREKSASPPCCPGGVGGKDWVCADFRDCTDDRDYNYYYWGHPTVINSGPISVPINFISTVFFHTTPVSFVTDTLPQLGWVGKLHDGRFLVDGFIVPADHPVFTQYGQIKKISPGFLSGLTESGHYFYELSNVSGYSLYDNKKLIWRLIQRPSYSTFYSYPSENPERDPGLVEVRFQPECPGFCTSLATCNYSSHSRGWHTSTLNVSLTNYSSTDFNFVYDCTITEGVDDVYLIQNYDYAFPGLLGPAGNQNYEDYVLVDNRDYLLALKDSNIVAEPNHCQGSMVYQNNQYDINLYDKTEKCRKFIDDPFLPNLPRTSENSQRIKSSIMPYLTPPSSQEAGCLVFGTGIVDSYPGVGFLAHEAPTLDKMNQDFLTFYDSEREGKKMGWGRARSYSVYNFSYQFYDLYYSDSSSSLWGPALVPTKIEISSDPQFDSESGLFVYQPRKIYPYLTDQNYLFFYLFRRSSYCPGPTPTVETIPPFPTPYYIMYYLRPIYLQGIEPVPPE